MNVEVIVGRSAHDDKHRTASRRWVTKWYQARGFTVTTGTATGKVWVKAEAFNSPALASSADVIVLADGDCFVSEQNLRSAIRGAAEVGWATPASKVWRMDKASTGRALRLDPATTDRPADPKLAQPPHDMLPGGGIVAFRRDLLHDLGGFDPRFVGWGGEDFALGCAARTLSGEYAHQTKGPMWHLWHPPQSNASAEFPDTSRLAVRYRVAKFRPDAMRDLIDEWRTTCSPPA